MVYQMALDTTSEGNFNTINPEEVTRLIENLVSSNNTKNTERKSVSSMDMQQLDEVKEKLDGVHKLLMKQVSFVEVETVGLCGNQNSHCRFTFKLGN